MGKGPKAVPKNAGATRGDKKPRVAFSTGGGGKEPRSDERSYKQSTPLWAFSMLDLGGPWCWSCMDAASIRLVHERLKNFETMTWSEIEGPENHPLSPSSLSREATRRLDELERDDLAESLFSLRVTGAKRVIGVRHQHIFKIMWWDPEHTVAPSKKKHT